MLSLGPSQRYFLNSGVADMRKGFDGLSGWVLDAMEGENSVAINWPWNWDLTSPKSRVRVIIRPILSKSKPDLQTGLTRIVCADLPERIVPKLSVGVGMLAAIICDKFLDHFPLYRQIKRYMRLGVRISKSTMGNWLRLVAMQLDPCIRVFLRKHVEMTFG